MQFPLNADVHLNGTRRPVVRVIHIAARTERTIGAPGAIRQVLPNIGRIRGLQVEWSSSGELLLQGDKRSNSVADQRESAGALRATDCSRGGATLNIDWPVHGLQLYRLPRCGARPKELQESTSFFAGWAVKEDVVPDCVLEEQADAATNRCLPAPGGIPSKTNLRSEVRIRLSY